MIFVQNEGGVLLVSFLHHAALCSSVKWMKTVGEGEKLVFYRSILLRIRVFACSLRESFRLQKYRIMQYWHYVFFAEQLTTK